jgi:hypothetical protein
MYDAFANLENTMTTYRNQDNSFYQNSKDVLDDFNNVRDFSKMGQTEENLVLNVIGSDKIKQRLQ